MTLKARITTVQDKLQQLAAKDKKMSIFGAGDDKFFGTEGHHYALNSALSEAEIVKIEKKLGIKFPKDYREFLKVIGDGGAGPSWGLFKVERSYPSDDFLKQYPEFCSMECPYGDDYANGIKAQMAEDGDYMEKVDAFGGYIKLSDYGHEMTAILIVSGQQTGKMWFLNEEDGMEIAPMVQNIEGRDWQVSFLDWYENWLDDSWEELNAKK